MAQRVPEYDLASLDLDLVDGQHDLDPEYGHHDLDPVDGQDDLDPVDGQCDPCRGVV